MITREERVECERSRAIAQQGTPTIARPNSAGQIHNPYKALVGTKNIAVGSLKMYFGFRAVGVGKFLGYSATALAVSDLRRGVLQVGEAYDPASEPTNKNFSGLLPFGQKFDDPNEPGAIEFSEQVWRRFRADPLGTFKSIVEDFFVFHPE